MDTEQIRKDFEEWMGDGGLSPRAIERNSKGDYILMQAAHAWEVWKAAHTHYAKPAAPVVLPEPGINTASHAGFRVIGYTEQQVRELLAKATCTKSQTQEPFGYFKVEPFGWRDCAETDDGAIALYEAPQPQADALDAARWSEIGKSIERACAELPEDFEINIHLESGAGTASLIYPSGAECEDFPHDDGFAGVMNAAIDAAIDAAIEGASA